MTEQKLRQRIRIMIAAHNEKYPHMPLIKWMDFEDAIVALMTYDDRPDTLRYS